MRKVFFSFRKGHHGRFSRYMDLKAEATSKIIPMIVCYPLGTALLSILILQEGVTFHWFISTALIVSGIILGK